MKKFILLLFLMTLFQQTYACDLCGCNSGNYFIGQYPQFKSFFIGTQYTYQRYTTILNSDKSQFSKDDYQTADLLLGAKFLNKWQLFAFVPYNHYYTLKDEGATRNNGLGDVTFLLDYSLLDIKALNKDTETVFQQLWIGGGMKLPTGKFTSDSTQLVTSANMQSGTGSYDFLINAIYSYQIKSWGFNFNANYKINQTAHNFRFGNSLGINTFVFRNFHLGQVTISPNLGGVYETFGGNINHSAKVADTGGYDLFAQAGFELRYQNFGLGGNVQYPVFFDLSSRQTTPQTRVLCHLSYMF